MGVLRRRSGATDSGRPCGRHVDRPRPVDGSHRRPARKRTAGTGRLRRPVPPWYIRVAFLRYRARTRGPSVDDARRARPLPSPVRRVRLCGRVARTPRRSRHPPRDRMSDRRRRPDSSVRTRSPGSHSPSEGGHDRVRCRRVSSRRDCHVRERVWTCWLHGTGAGGQTLRPRRRHVPGQRLTPTLGTCGRPPGGGLRGVTVCQSWSSPASTS